MSRVNKYRAWCKHWWVENSQDKTEYFMEYNIETIILENTPNFPHGRFIGKRGLWCAIHESILMQYIGVDDKNGKEIYEGDIVKIHQFLFDGCEYEKEIIVSIEYMEETACFGVNLLQAEEIRRYMGYAYWDKEKVVIPLCNFYGLHEESFEVIGNVYENADLLKEVEISE